MDDTYSILPSDNLELIDSAFEGLHKLYLFKPGVFKLFPKSGNMHKMDFKQKMRFFLLFIHGYRVYVLADSSDKVMGCAMFASGKTYRYPFATGKDLVCGPYYVMPDFRRQGIATKLLRGVIDRYENDYEFMYAHIWYTNQASVACMEKLGFAQVDTLSTTRILQKCISDKKGKLILVKKKNPERV